MSFDLSDLTFGLSDLTLNAAGLLSTREKRFRRLAGEHADLMDSLTPEVRKRVEVLTEIQGQHDELKANFVKEKDALEAKYQKLYEPLYTKRYEIVNALVEVEDVIKEAGDETPVEGTTEKGVPGFWLAAMKANQVLEEEIQERDEEALKFLKDIKWYRIDDPRGFKLEFFFDLNPYFKNSVLTKTYHVAEEDDEVTLEKAIGTEIDWFAGKCLTQKIVKKKAKMGMMNVIRPTTKTVNCKSFFNFFNPPPIPTDEEDTNEEMQNQCEADYEMGSIIRDEIIPRAVLWFIQEVARARRSFSKSSSDSELVIV